MTSPTGRRPERAATSADVARLAGVSRATVSFVLNDAPQSIPTETRERVLRAAKMLSYRPNLAAKSLAEGSSRIILIELPALPPGSPAFQVVAELTAALADLGMVAAVHLDTLDRHVLVNTALRLRPRSVVLSHEASEAERATLEAAGIEAVDASASGYVDVEHVGARTRLRHLADRGHTRVTIVERELPGSAPAVAARRAAVRSAGAELGLPGMDTVVLDDGPEAAATVRRLVDAGTTAVCAYNDDAALAVLRAAADAGVRCPDDLAVVGFDNTFAGSVAFPPLTSIAVDAHRLGDIIAPSMLAALGLREPSDLPDLSDLSDVVRLVVRSST